MRNVLNGDDPLGHEPWSHTHRPCVRRCTVRRNSGGAASCSGAGSARTKPRAIQRGGVHYGWAPRNDSSSRPKPILWAASRQRLPRACAGLACWRETRRSRKSSSPRPIWPCAPTRQTEPDGGWHVVPHPRNPRLVNTYVNVLALLVLLDTRRADLPWDGSTQRRDALIQQTANWLVSTYDSGTPAGWYKDNGRRTRWLTG